MRRKTLPCTETRRRRRRRREPFELVEVAKQMKNMQNSKECGPDGVPTESLRLVDKIDPMLICDQVNAALEKGIPAVWRTSILTT